MWPEAACALILDTQLRRSKCGHQLNEANELHLSRKYLYLQLGLLTKNTNILLLCVNLITIVTAPHPPSFPTP